ncbi:uncharacterized protein ACLA_067500 [Aspergillus clavatus NRRL 1]|uniref:Uncharacterized protein n=1 Tax=Aspergillus clavatus (strain ATCC 1007 / CBS 513.65 / DSM 816 / NCTC 3887 / NRRL 1 / QM 1276 / 107) TaxID=344612 RepID=A1CGN1_ASPCL|nr:uncharacterized protein ACLA_067500 [Aspergillus clavatus NRRL 1]EAW11111.1 hypothetical protein ACLA_067500 [Aspergillus clavatus NRRL 1]
MHHAGLSAQFSNFLGNTAKISPDLILLPPVGKHIPQRVREDLKIIAARFI